MRRRSKLLFRTLATTDLCVGIIVGPFAVAFWVSAVKEGWEIYRFTYDQARTYFMFGGQTSRPVVRQTSCNFEKRHVTAIGFWIANIVSTFFNFRYNFMAC